MGTNYYVNKKPDLVDILRGEEDLELHLGKSSAGWCFSLRIYPEMGLVNLETWYKFLSKGRITITDEYGTTHDIDDVIHRITKRSWKHEHTLSDIKKYPDRFHKDGCRRHTSSDQTKPGKGSYDLCNYEFS